MEAIEIKGLPIRDLRRVRRPSHRPAAVSHRWFYSLTIPQLVAELKSRGIELSKSMRKDTLRELLKVVL